MSYGNYRLPSSEELYKKWYEEGNKERDQLQEKLWNTESELSSKKSEISRLQQQVHNLRLDVSLQKSGAETAKSLHQREVNNIQRMLDESQSNFRLLLAKYTSLSQRYESLLASATSTQEVFASQKKMIGDLRGQLQDAANDGARKEDEIQRKEAENQRLLAEIALLRQQLLEKQVAQETPAAAAPLPTPL